MIWSEWIFQTGVIESELVFLLGHKHILFIILKNQIITWQILKIWTQTLLKNKIVIVNYQQICFAAYF